MTLKNILGKIHLHLKLGTVVAWLKLCSRNS